MKAQCKVKQRLNKCPAETIERQREIIRMLAAKCSRQQREIIELKASCKECRFRELYEDNI